MNEPTRQPESPRPTSTSPSGVANPTAVAATIPVSPTVGSVTEATESTQSVRYGRFLVRRFHAKGGLGEVHLAEDEELGREVALKRMQDRHVDNPKSRIRFLQEAAITAKLQHPGIVPIYGLVQDGRGQPGYAMRFIEGQSLKEACNAFHREPKHRNRFNSLSFRQLLQRFVSACQTIAYAHSKEVIHRDIKPANIMLGAFGETLVVDWGLAKSMAGGQSSVVREEPVDESLTSDHSPLGTAPGEALGTPAYMSPEQATGEWDAVRPASDIYSLGGTLYELLTGRLPTSGGDWSEMRAKILQGQRPRPCQIEADVPPPLEAICSKAMALRPADRYASAAELAADVERWLADEPVTCYREPSLLRARRWARKHRAVVSTAVGLLFASVAALAIGLVAVEGERRQTAQERDRKEVALQAETKARAAEAKARTLAMNALRKLTDDVVEQQLARRTVLNADERRFLRDIQSQYEEFAALSGEDVEQRAIRAEGHLRVALLRSQLGEMKEAEGSFQQAVSLYRQLADSVPSRPEFREQLANSEGNFGNLLRNIRRIPEAETAYTDALEIYRKLAAEFPDRPEFRLKLALIHNNLGNLWRNAGRLRQAETAHVAAVDIHQRLVADFPDRTDFRLELAHSQSNLGIFLTAAGRLPEAEKAHLAALAIEKQLAAASPGHAEFRRELGVCQNNLGNLYRMTGRGQDAETAFTAALTLGKQLTAEFPGRPEFREELANAHHNLGVLYQTSGRRADAEAAYVAAIATRKQLNADFPGRPDFLHGLAESHNNLGVLYREMGRAQDAQNAYTAALTIKRQLAADSSTGPDNHNDLAGTLVNLAALANDRRDFVQARQWLEEAHPHHQAALRSSPKHPVYRQFYQTNLFTLVQSCAGQGDQTAALAVAAKFRDLGLNPVSDAYSAACALALSVDIVAKDDKARSEEREKQQRIYADEAMAMLRVAVAKGYKDAIGIKKDPSLAALRQREDFQKLIMELEK